MNNIAVLISTYENFYSQLEEKKEAWLEFMERGVEPKPATINTQIFSSWKKSLSCNINPFMVKQKRVDPEDLASRIAKCHDFVAATMPVLHSYLTQVENNVSSMDLYDPDLVLIHKLDISDSQESIREKFALLGLIRDEQISGITAMSLAKKMGSPIQLIGAEHFDYTLHERMCTSVPIYYPNKHLAGVITIAEKCSPSGIYTLQTLAALGKGIEYNLLLTDKQNKLESLSQLNQSILEVISQAIITIDNDGNVLQASKAASNVLNLPFDNLLMLNINDLFNSNPFFVQQLLEKKTLTNFTISLKQNPENEILRFLASTYPISDSHGVGSRQVIVLNDIASTKKIVKSLGGWNASFTFKDLLGESLAFTTVVELAKQTASLSSNTLLEGESGTGKELFAQAIHNTSSFSSGPFVAINCAAIPINLMESELFGYEGGAYTGAKKNGQPGKFEIAEGGTIFLDEINSMPLNIQAKLLRVLQEKTITRIGGTSSISLNLKIIAASNVDLEDMVSKNLFRSDLFYRLNVITIRIPPLRKRLSDINLLLDSILKNVNSVEKSSYSFTDDALLMLKEYSWPGNIRELENVVEKAVIQANLFGKKVVDKTILLMLREFSEISIEQSVETMQIQNPQKYSSAPGEQLYNALSQNYWNVSRTAKSLNISRSTLYRRIHKYNIALPK